MSDELKLFLEEGLKFFNTTTDASTTDASTPAPDTGSSRQKRQTSVKIERFPLDSCQTVIKNIINIKQGSLDNRAKYQKFLKDLETTKKIYNNYQVKRLNSIDKRLDVYYARNANQNVNIEFYCTRTNINLAAELYLQYNFAIADALYICSTLFNFKRNYDNMVPMEKPFKDLSDQYSKILQWLASSGSACKIPYNERQCSKTADLYYKGAYAKTACYVNLPLNHYEAYEKCRSFGMDLYYYEKNSQESLRIEFDSVSSSDVWVNGGFLFGQSAIISKSGAGSTVNVDFIPTDSSKTSFTLTKKFTVLTAEPGQLVRPFFCEYISVGLAARLFFS